MGAAASVDSPYITKSEVESLFVSYKVDADVNKWWADNINGEGKVERKTFLKSVRWMLVNSRVRSGQGLSSSDRFTEIVRAKSALELYLNNELLADSGKNSTTKVLQVPQDWEVLYLPEKGCVYFRNKTTGQTDWDIEGCSTGKVAAGDRYAAEQVRVPLPDGWAAYWDEESQSCYFHNSVDDTTSWERPSIGADGVLDKQIEFIGGNSSFSSSDIFALLHAKKQAKRWLKQSVLSCLSLGNSTEKFPLPEGWKAIVDESTGQIYFHHAESGDMSLHRPGTELKASNEEGPIDDAEFAMDSIKEGKSLIQRVKETGEVFALPEGWTAKYDPDENMIYFEHIESGNSTWDNPSEDSPLEFTWQLNHMHSLPHGSVYRGWTVTHEPERRWLSIEEAEKNNRYRYSETFAQQPLAYEEEAAFVGDEGKIYYFPSGTMRSTWHQPDQQNFVLLPDGWLLKMKYETRYKDTPATTIYAHKCVTRIQAKFRGDKGRRQAKARKEEMKRRRAEQKKRHAQLNEELDKEREKHLDSHTGGQHAATNIQDKFRGDRDKEAQSVNDKREAAKRRQKEKLEKRRRKTQHKAT